MCIKTFIHSPIKKEKSIIDIWRIERRFSLTRHLKKKIKARHLSTSSNINCRRDTYPSPTLYSALEKRKRDRKRELASGAHWKKREREKEKNTRSHITFVNLRIYRVSGPSGVRGNVSSGLAASSSGSSAAAAAACQQGRELDSAARHPVDLHQLILVTRRRLASCEHRKRGLASCK